MPLGVLVAHHHLEVLGELGKAVERELHRAVPLRRDDPESASLGAKPSQYVLEAVERLERLVQRVVVLLVDLDELVHAVRVEIAGHKVGYLPRDLAPAWGPRLAELASRKRVGACEATIVGGADTALGVFLRLPPPGAGPDGELGRRI